MVEEVMLQEAFDLPSTQILSLYALGNYLGSKPQLTVSETEAATLWEAICQHVDFEINRRLKPLVNV